MNDVMLDDVTLSSSGQHLVNAAHIFAAGTTAPVVQMRSVTGISSEVQSYLQSIVLAQLALCDAAKTGSRAVGSMMQESREFDQKIAASLGTGYLVSAGKSLP